METKRPWRMSSRAPCAAETGPCFSSSQCVLPFRSLPTLSLPRSDNDEDYDASKDADDDDDDDGAADVEPEDDDGEAEEDEEDGDEDEEGGRARKRRRTGADGKAAKKGGKKAKAKAKPKSKAQGQQRSPVRPGARGVVQRFKARSRRPMEMAEQLKDNRVGVFQRGDLGVVVRRLPTAPTHLHPAPTTTHLCMPTSLIAPPHLHPQQGCSQVPDMLNRGEPQTVHEAARSALQLKAIPSSLPCRERELEDIERHLSHFVRKGSGALYVAGVPGTGKTASVKEVMRRVERRIISGDLPKVQYAEINGFRLQSPKHVYSAILEAREKSMRKDAHCTSHCRRVGVSQAGERCCFVELTGPTRCRLSRPPRARSKSRARWRRRPRRWRSSTSASRRPRRARGEGRTAHLPPSPPHTHQHRSSVAAFPFPRAQHRVNTPSNARSRPAGVHDADAAVRGRDRRPHEAPQERDLVHALQLGHRVEQPRGAFPSSRSPVAGAARAGKVAPPSR